MLPKSPQQNGKEIAPRQEFWSRGIRIAQGTDSQSWSISDCQRRIVFSERNTSLACANTPSIHGYRHLQPTTSSSLMDLGDPL